MMRTWAGMRSTYKSSTMQLSTKQLNRYNLVRIGLSLGTSRPYQRSITVNASMCATFVCPSSQKRKSFYSIQKYAKSDIRRVSRYTGVQKGSAKTKLPSLRWTGPSRTSGAKICPSYLVCSLITRIWTYRSSASSFTWCVRSKKMVSTSWAISQKTDWERKTKRIISLVSWSCPASKTVATEKFLSRCHMRFQSSKVSPVLRSDRSLI